MPRIFLLLCLMILNGSAQQNTTLVDRVGSTGFLQLEAESFKELTPKQKELAYWLSQASIAIDPIIYDQLSRWGWRQKDVLELVVAHPDGIKPDVYKKIADFTKLFWGNKGNHHEQTAQKFLPECTFDELKQSALTALTYTPHSRFTQASLSKELDDLKPSLFDPNFEPMMTAKSPKPGQDILQASSNDFYVGVTAADMLTFKEQYPLNTRLAKIDGKLVEQVYRAGTPDGRVKPGLYAKYLTKANGYFEKAAMTADPVQAKVIRDLIRYYQTGDLKDWITFGIDWVQNNEPVDFANGFIEVYRDARGAKGTSQSFVSITDQHLNSMMIKIAQNAQYFEGKAPWAAQYKNAGVKPPLAKAVETAIETGDFHVTTVGDNLPNENEIHEKYGSKSFLFTGSSRALDRAAGYSAVEEFAASPEEVTLVKKYGEEAEGLLTALHEIIGHGSGKLNPKLTHDPAYYLKQYYSTLEEARADLMALWNVWDPKLKELGLSTNQQDVAKAMYYNSTRVAITQLRRNPKGDTLEEDHQRDRQLIVNYIKDKTGAIAEETRNGKTYLAIRDFSKMRQGVGMLLAELMRIKGEGDYDAIKALIDKYGVHFDPKLRNQVMARYEHLDLPTYWTGINPELKASFGSHSEVTGVAISYPRDYVKQQLRYSSMYAGQARQ
jgi:dipeptidyl-peptidase-3